MSIGTIVHVTVERKSGRLPTTGLPRFQTSLKHLQNLLGDVRLRKSLGSDKTYLVELLQCVTFRLQVQFLQLRLQGDVAEDTLRGLTSDTKKKVHAAAIPDVAIQMKAIFEPRFPSCNFAALRHQHVIWISK